MIARLPLRQRQAFELMLQEGVAKGDYSEIAKFLNDLEKENKPPTNFEWNDPNDHSRGVRAIAGGPGEHVPAELAGRLAFMDTAMQRMPMVRETFLRPWGLNEGMQNLAAGGGDASGRFDIPRWSGDIGLARSAVRMMVEGALRAQTGANAPKEEVLFYTQLFTPGVTDDEKSAREKLDRLEQFAQQYRALAMSGRTSDPASLTQPRATQPPAPAARANDPLGIR